MARYQTKPTIIEATQWIPGKPHPDIFFAEDKFEPYGAAIFHTPLGPVRVFPGDWVVIMDGEKQICRAHVFEDLYELVKE